MSKGRLIVISAPSGAGKGTVIGEIRKKRPDIAYSISATTRNPRPGEEHGREYYFVTGEEFATMEARGEFLECESYVGRCYGTPIGPIRENIDKGVDTILEIEVKGARKVKARMPEAVMVFISPPSEEELRRRLVGRGTSTDEEIEERMCVAKEEMRAVNEYEYNVINDDAIRAADEIIEIIDSQRR